MSVRTRRLVVAPLLVVLVAVALVLVLRGRAEADPRDRVDQIAERVERLRGLDFKRMPKVERLTTDEVTERLEADLAELPSGEQGEVATQQELTALLGFSSRGADLSDSADATGIAGIYDDETETLTIVTDAPGGRDERELTIAHELVHALEDQHFDLGRLLRGSKDDDRLSAQRALAEGSAHLLEERYARRYMGGGRSVAALAERQPASTVRGQAYYGANDTRFAYLDGARYVANVQRDGDGTEAIDAEFRDPPATTRTILHPTVDAGEPADVALDVRRAAGAGFERLASGTFGEFDTGQLLVLGAASEDATTRLEAARVAAGWRGGRYELLRAGGTDDAGCSEPCVERNLAVLAWEFDSADAAEAFARGLDPYLGGLQQLETEGGGVWTGEAVTVVVRTDGTSARLVFAPTRTLAERVARVA